MHLQQGLLEIYCGDGKGKTTAALGLALRAAGCGLRVHIVQFLKGTETGELASLAQIPQISLVRCDKNWGFTFSMTEQDKKEITVSQPDAAGGEFHGKKRRNRRADFR